jgi:NAD(P)-dependent dehydrogenase (short-subunit alcohol dehydrogenase family)
MIDFTGKLVYITGGSSGIGLACANGLVALGADVVLLARNLETLRKTAEDVKAHRRDPRQNVFILSVDVADPQDVEAKMVQAVTEFCAPDILINSAGINKYSNHFDRITADMFDETMKTNVYGVRHVTAALLAPMKQKKGHVVILSSAAGLFGMFGYTAYAASKAALIGFAESLRYELKPLGMPVTVVCPPEVDTPMNIYDAKTLPPEGRAMKSMAGLLTPEYTAGEIIKAISRKTFFCIPGRTTPFLYFFHRLTNGWITRLVSDMVVRIARRK